MTAESIERVPYAEGWTVGDLDRLPEDHHRYELIDGVLHVTPSPSDEHQEVGNMLWALLRAAAPPGLRATTGVGVVVAPDGFLIPDVLVVRGDRPRKRGDFPAADVLLAVEVVSRSTRSMDRWHKPHLYSAAGVRSYWRIELDPLHLVAYRLGVTADAGQAEYIEIARVGAGARFTTTEPFPIEFDPASLLP